jgi:hypothetical protein
MIDVFVCARAVVWKASRVIAKRIKKKPKRFIVPLAMIINPINTTSPKCVAFGGGREGVGVAAIGRVALSKANGVVRKNFS